ncbi:hypothetical protein JCM8097_005848 [Rhodosporidiobolus ruineniae]
MSGIASDSSSSALRDHLQLIPEYSTQRIQFYYSSLPPKKLSNPTGYSSAVQWWRRTLVDLVQRGFLTDDKLVLTADDELREMLRWDKVGRPSSLGVVIAELAQSLDLIPLPTYLSQPLPPASSGESSFSIVSLLTRPFWWGLSKVWGSGEGGVDLGEKADENEWKKRKGEWVVPDLVERAASSLLPHLSTKHASALSRLYTLRTFRDEFGGLCLPDVTFSERDCEVLVRYLEAKGECSFDGEVVKFAAPHSAPNSSLPIITPSDRSILTLRATLSSLSSYISTLESRIAAEQALVHKYATGSEGVAKNVALAKSHIQARKRVEKLLEEKVGARAKVEEVMMGIERAVGDEETLQALSLGTSTLRSILSSPTLQLDNIAATTSALDDSLIAAQEVSDAVEGISAPERAEWEGEVEDELRELQMEEEREKEESRVREAERKLEGAEGKKAEVPSLEKPAEQEAEEAEKVIEKGEKLVA